VCREQENVFILGLVVALICVSCKVDIGRTRALPELREVLDHSSGACGPFQHPHSY
jgi:hypothetical protein